MSQRDREKLVVLEAVQRREISVSEAARRLGITRRHAIRLKQRYLAEGAGGIPHRLRERRPGNRKPKEPVDRQRAVQLYAARYPDYGPTLAAEKLLELDGIKVPAETLRRWLIEAGHWQRQPRRGPHRTRRPRRPRFGQLLQLDGSDHDWFQGRAPRCCLMVLIDDATGRVALHLAPSEDTRAALTVVRKWVERHGVPEAIYTDRNTVYWSQQALQQPQLRDRREVHGEWGRVMTGNLGIALIPAYSPQAKGRVERSNGIFQDRLVKELRLRGIDTIREANAMLDEYAGEHNARFAKTPAEPLDAHRVFAPSGEHERELAFSVDFARAVTRDNTVSLAGQCYQIPAQADAPRPGAKVTLWRAMDGVVRGQWQGRDLAIKPFDPRADRFRHRCASGIFRTAAADSPAEATGARDALGDQSPSPPGIYRIGAKAGGERPQGATKGGTAIVGRPAPASASGAVLGLRPRMALSPARGKPVSRKTKPGGM
jgi:transposase